MNDESNIQGCSQHILSYSILKGGQCVDIIDHLLKTSHETDSDLLKILFFLYIQQGIHVYGIFAYICLSFHRKI